MHYQIYFVRLGDCVYKSTSITEISAFAKLWGKVGHVGMGKKVSFEIENVERF
jgi:hypothetical protein